MKYTQEIAIALTALDAKFEIKLLSDSAKIFPESCNDWQAVADLCKQKSWHFFSHKPKADRRLKVVLKGLPEVSAETVRKALEEMNVEPIEVRKIPTKSSFSMFGVDFQKGDITLKLLNEQVPHIRQHRVSWIASKPKRPGPAICLNCAMIGHGTASCFRPAVCVICACAHKMHD